MGQIRDILDRFILHIQKHVFQNQQILYVTERAVFRLQEKELELIEIAPGIDLQKDILDQMDFLPLIPENLKTMDASIFMDEQNG